ncbi:MAG: S8 family serine peptidase, partial [Candidatus Omnitrophica bacterium]|nr:S8 family serine peptidase [Candidatus Omnitrophota bacterium]
QGTQNSGLSYKPGELIVKVREGCSISDIDGLNSQYKATAVERSFPAYIEPKERLDLLKREIIDLSEGHNSWYWQLDKNSDEYKKYEAKLEAKKKDLEARIRREADAVARFEAYNEECRNSEEAPPNLDQIYCLKFDSSMDAGQLAEIYKNDPAVEYAHPNYIAKINMLPDDPYYSSSGAWGQSFRDLWGLVKIEAEKAWDTTQGEGIIVAVSDTGVDYNHPDLNANMWKDSDGHYGYNFVSDNYDPMDDYGHGTHCAGTIAAVGNNNLGIIGVAPKVKIMAVKGLGSDGSGEIDKLVKTIQYAADNGADVINCSWGGQMPDGCTSIRDVVRYATGVRNSVVVAAAGNSHVDVEKYSISPANIKEVITVAASDSEDQWAYFSNYGAKIDVAAPGGGDSLPRSSNPERSILSLKASLAVGDITNNGTLIVDGDYLRQAGTSMACPHVSGVAALIKSLHRDFTPEQVRQAMRAGSDDILAPGFDLHSGCGRVNALGAISVDAPIIPKIIEPASGKYDNITDILIKYTVSGDDITGWTIEWGGVDRTYNSVADPASWDIIAQGNGPVTVPSNCDWDVRTVPDGKNIIRIRATNSAGREFTDRVVIKISHVVITKPETDFYNYYGYGNNVVIEGTVNPYDLKECNIALYKDNDNQPSTLLRSDYIYTPVTNGRIWEWDIKNVPGGYYSINLIARTNWDYYHPAVRSFPIGIDPSLHPGWPIRVPKFIDGYGYEYPPVNALTIADINSDGRDDILLNYNGQIDVIDHTGVSLPGWPKVFAPEGDFSQNGATVGDVMGTGKSQVIVATCGGEIHIFDSSGNFIKKLSGEDDNGCGPNPNVAVADIDKDGKNEMIVTAGTKVTVVDRDGEKWSEDLTEDLPENELYQPTVADLNGDGTKEIIVKAVYGTSRVYVFDCLGNILQGWPKDLCAADSQYRGISSAPIAADIDNNGKLEIVTTSNDNKVHVLRSDGAELNGWPVRLSYAGKSLEHWMTGVGQVVAGDMDGDGSFEIVAGLTSCDNSDWNWVDTLYVLKSNGQRYSKKWPVNCKNQVCGGWFYGFSPPGLADINNDGLPEIIVTGYAYLETNEAFRVYDIDGRELEGFRKPIYGLTAWSSNSPAIGDFSGSGKNQIVWIMHNFHNFFGYESEINGIGSSPYYLLYLSDTNASSSGPKPWPMYHHDPQHTGAAALISVKPHTPSPSDLTAGAVSSSEIDISWRDNSTNEKNFYIERKTAGDVYSEIAKVNANTVLYKDKKAIPGMTYYYRICALSPNGYSDYSNEASATPPFPAPTNLAASAVLSTEIGLSWKDNSTDEKKFCIERKAGPGGTYSEIERASSNKTAYKDKDKALKVGTTYYYRVRAVNKAGYYSD